MVYAALVARVRRSLNEVRMILKRIANATSAKDAVFTLMI
jgi:hypothetical protein